MIPKYSSLEIKEKRQKVREAFLKQSKHVKNGSIQSISPADLELLFDLYEEHFLMHWFKRNSALGLNFSFSTKMTRSAGMTLFHKKKGLCKSTPIEIRISMDFILNFDRGQREKTVGGLVVLDSLDALQHIFEHEICHGIELIETGKSSCKQKPFKELILNLFGHEASTHTLASHSEIAQDVLGFRIGGIYGFDYEGQVLMGQMTGIRKNAVLMVEDPCGDFQNQNKHRFSKFYVPLTALKKVMK